MGKPNVIIIMADHLRADVLGKGYTPNIDSIGSDGVLFSRAYCASPLCVPARGAFFTGKYPNLNGSIINPWEKADAVYGNVHTGTENLYGLMEEEWDSWHIGKQHFITEEKIDRLPDAKTHWTYTEKDYRKFLEANAKKGPGGYGYSGMLPEMALGHITRMKKYSVPATGCYEEGFEYFFDGYFAKGAVEAIKNRDQSKPFLLNAMFFAPHPPFQIPEPWYSRVKEADLPENVGNWYPDQSPLQLYNLPGFIGTRYTREDWWKIWPVYLGLVSLLDDCVGMIIDELKAQGIYDETLILFTGDHGEMLGSHCLWQKTCMYEEASKIPLFIRFPKSYTPKIRETDIPVSAVDILPTLCEYLGIRTPDGLSGVSLMPLVQDGEINREEIFIQSDGNGARGNFQRCVVQGDYKLIVDIFKDEIYLELYNVKKDVQEMVNLAFDEDYGRLLKEMLIKIRKYMKDTNDLIDIPEGTYRNFIKDYAQFRKK